MMPSSRLPADQAELSYDTWYDLRAGLSKTRPGHQHHRATAKAMFDLQENIEIIPSSFVQPLVEFRRFDQNSGSICLSLPHSVVPAGHHARGDQKIFPRRSPYLIW
jgi:hypothetical protein